MSYSYRSSYASKLAYLWGLSRKGSLTSDNTIWKELRDKSNLSELQAELDAMTVHYVK